MARATIPTLRSRRSTQTLRGVLTFGLAKRLSLGMPLSVGLLCSLGLLLGSSATAEPTSRPDLSTGLSRTHDGFCTEVQQLLVPTTLGIVNVIEPDFEAFKLSKPKAKPLTTHQFLTPARADGLRQVSCKTKSADHLRAVYGVEVAAAPPSHSQPALQCRDVHRAMVLALWREASSAQRADAVYPPHRIMLAADLAYLTGSSWVQSAASAHTGDDGRLHLRAARLFASWEDWRWKVLPESLRGNHYCHLIAPESLRELMFGSRVTAPR